MKEPILICENDHSTADDPTNVIPYSLLKAELIDPATQRVYKASPTLPAKPYWGNSSTAAPIRYQTWFQLAVQFEVPPPPLTRDGEYTEQRVSILLPKAKGPIHRVLIPPPAKKE